MSRQNSKKPAQPRENKPPAPNPEAIRKASNPIALRYWNQCLQTQNSTPDTSKNTETVPAPTFSSPQPVPNLSSSLCPSNSQFQSSPPSRFQSQPSPPSYIQSQFSPPSHIQSQPSPPSRIQSQSFRASNIQVEPSPASRIQLNSSPPSCIHLQSSPSSRIQFQSSPVPSNIQFSSSHPLSKAWFNPFPGADNTDEFSLSHKPELSSSPDTLFHGSSPIPKSYPTPRHKPGYNISQGMNLPQEMVPSPGRNSSKRTYNSSESVPKNGFYPSSYQHNSTSQPPPRPPSPVYTFKPSYVSLGSSVSPVSPPWYQPDYKIVPLLPTNSSDIPSQSRASSLPPWSREPRDPRGPGESGTKPRRRFIQHEWPPVNSIQNVPKKHIFTKFHQQNNLRHD